MWSCSWIHTAEHGTSETVREIVVSEAYVALKRHNVELAHGDIDVYLALKAGLIAGLLRRAREANRPVNTVRRATPPAVGNAAGQLPRPGLPPRGRGGLMNSEPVGGS